MKPPAVVSAVRAHFVWAAMLAYPRYVLPGVQGLASAEQVLQHLVAQSASGGRAINAHL